ncbi:MAG: hypothetical protein QM752_06140 [Gammaproteobacteria bacterium]
MCEDDKKAGCAPLERKEKVDPLAEMKKITGKEFLSIWHSIPSEQLRTHTESQYFSSFFPLPPLFFTPYLSSYESPAPEDSILHTLNFFDSTIKSPPEIFLPDSARFNPVSEVPDISDSLPNTLEEPTLSPKLLSPIQPTIAPMISDSNKSEVKAEATVQESKKRKQPSLSKATQSQKTEAEPQKTEAEPPSFIPTEFRLIGYLRPVPAIIALLPCFIADNNTVYFLVKNTLLTETKLYNSFRISFAQQRKHALKQKKIKRGNSEKVRIPHQSIIYTCLSDSADFLKSVPDALETLPEKKNLTNAFINIKFKDNIQRELAAEEILQPLRDLLVSKPYSLFLQNHADMTQPIKNIEDLAKICFLPEKVQKIEATLTAMIHMAKSQIPRSISEPSSPSTDQDSFSSPSSPSNSSLLQSPDKLSEGALLARVGLFSAPEPKSPSIQSSDSPTEFEANEQREVLEID